MRDSRYKAAMLIGLMISAVVGGLAGTAWSVAQSHDLPQVLAAYPLGGILAVLAFLVLTSLRADPFQSDCLPRD